MRMLSRRMAMSSLILAGAFVGAPVRAETASDDVWPSLERDIFKGRRTIADAGIVALQAPKQAEDAAIVPMTIMLEKPAADIRAVTLVIDNNPAPMAASFRIGPNSGLTMISTRVRVNDPTNVHVVAETSDGALHVVKRFVQAAGGCSAPSAKNMDERLANLGAIRVRQIPAGDLVSARRREAQIMIRHPNNSGMQMDQATNLYIPARYVDNLTVKLGEELLFQMEGGISLSEDPSFRFTYIPNGAKTLSIKGRDSAGAVFGADAPIDDAS